MKIEYKDKGWIGKGDYEAAGMVYDAKKKPLMKLEGFWNSELYSITNSNEKVLLVKRHPVPENCEYQYNFTKWDMNLNLFHKELIPKLPPTDSRLRPDIRALEYGDYDLASKEKDRLEVKQRAKRYEMEKSGAVH